MMMTKENVQRLGLIADRGVKLFAELGVTVDRLDVLMDLEYCNDDIPLDLDVLEAFGSRDFDHDLIGIYRHFNRDTKKLENGFVPRCAAQAKAST